MKNDIELKVAAFLLVDKIIIDTMKKRDAGTWYTKGEPSILPLDSSNSDLGNSILGHLSQSKEEAATYDQMKEYWKTLIKKAGYKTEKAFLQKCKRVAVIIQDDKIQFEP